MPKRDEIFYLDKAFTSGFLPLVLLKESDKEGKIWDVRIIDAGWSKNGVYYSGSVLREASKLFDGAKVNAFQFKDHYFDHLPDNASEIIDQGFARNLAGWIDNIVAEKVNGKEGLSGKFHVTDPFFRGTFKNAWDAGKKNLLGFSIDAKGKLMPGVAEGKSGKIAKEIKRVESLDIVTLPAAGGRLMRMVASQGGKIMNEEIKKLVGMVRENPEILGLKEGENIEDKSDEEVFGMLTTALNAHKKAEGDDTQEAEKTPEQKKKEEEEKKAKEAKEKEAKAAKEGEEGKSDDEKKKAAEEAMAAVKEAGITPEALMKISELLKANKVDEALAMIDSVLNAGKEKEQEAQKAQEAKEAKEALAKGEAGNDEVKNKIAELDKTIEKANIRESNIKLKEILGEDKVLPEIVKTKIQKQFEGNLFEEDALRESIKVEKDTLAALSKSGEVTGMGTEHITTGLTPDSRLQIAMHKLFGIEPEENEKEDFAKVPDFEGIKEAYIRMTGDKAIRGEVDERMREAVSADFPQALGTSMERRLLKEYSRVAITAAWKKFAVIDKPTNFKQQDLIRLGGLGDLPVVAEDGTYTEFVSPSEELASYNVAKRGKIFKITREMIKNDDLRIIQKIPIKMGQSAARTLAKFVFDLVLNVSSGVINAGTIYDALALYHASHSNLTANALDYDTLDDAITAMGNQAEPDSGESLDIKAQFLLVPNEKRAVAKILVGSEKRPAVDTAGGRDGTLESINPNYQAVEPIIIPKGYLRNDANNWFVIGDKRDAEGVVVGFLDGRETPEILLQDNPTVDTVFTNDRIKYKIRHEYSGVIADYRPFYAGLEAGIS